MTFSHGDHMLTARPAGSAARLLDAGRPEDSVAGAVWFDLLNPTADEEALAARITGLTVPTRADLDEIESSSRLYRDDGALYLSTPLARLHDGDCSTIPMGLVVSDKFLVSVRFSDYPAIEAYARGMEKAAEPLDAHALMVGLLEAIVDRLADLLEIIGGQLDRVSVTVFRADALEKRRRADRTLRELLHDIGRQGDAVSRLRDTMLGLQRLVLFVQHAEEVRGQALHDRVATLAADLKSLTEFDGQVNDKVHFLLDATLGLINVEQNNGIRILTVVSLIGIPPTLIASIYGMNFKDIPELSWSFGYWYALILMAVSVLVPLAWFKRVGWI